MRPLLVPLAALALALASTLAGCASGREAIPTRPPADPALAAAPTRSADVRIEAVLLEVDPDALDAVLTTPLDAFCAVGRLARADREAVIAAALRPPFGTPALTLRSGARGSLSAILQRAYVGDWRVLESAAEPRWLADPVVRMYETGMWLAVRPEARAGAVSLDVSLEATWDLAPPREVRVTLRDRLGRDVARDVALEVPSVLSRTLERRFDLAPGDVALIAVRRGEAGRPWVVLLTAEAGA